jgi:hypothetical protein
VGVPAAGKRGATGLGLGEADIDGDGDGAGFTVTASVEEWSFGLVSEELFSVKDAVLLTLGTAWLPTATVIVKLALAPGLRFGVPVQVTTWPLAEQVNPDVPAAKLW